MNEPVKITCGICDDLAPLVEDHVAVSESIAAVRMHLEVCESCRKKHPALSEALLAAGPVPAEPSSRREPSFSADTASDRPSLYPADEIDHTRIVKQVRDHLSRWVLLGIMLCMAVGVLIAVTSSSGPWLTILIFPLICGVTYWFRFDLWKRVPFAAAGFWILITLMIDLANPDTVSHMRVSLMDSLLSAVFPLIFSYIGALAAALLKYAFKGRFK